MDFKESIRKLKDNPELAKSLGEAFRRKADPAEIRLILADAGADPEPAEALVVAYQRELGMVIADEDVDEEMLKKVAGGGCGKCTEAADCDQFFKNPEYWGMTRCTFAQYCDEYTNDPRCDNSAKGY